MDFCNALKMMKLGVKMTRMEWDNQEDYIVLEGGTFKRNVPDKKTRLPTIFFGHEILAEDWEVVRQKNTA